MTWVYEVALLLSQWIGALLILLGIHQMERKAILAPVLLMTGGLCMLIFGVLAQAWGVVLVNAVAVVLNYRCWKRWKSNE